MISRRARREAAAAAEAAAARPDPRIAVIERTLTALQVGANVYVFALCAVGWLWLAAQGPGSPGSAAGTTGAVADTVPQGALAGLPFVASLAGASGATLVLIMLATCLLMAPIVNPFYAPPPEQRVLHTSTTLLFGVLAVTTVAVIAGAAR